MNTFKVIGTIGVCLGVVAYALDDTISRFFDRRDHPDAHEYGRAHSVDVESLSPDSESDDNEKGAIFPTYLGRANSAKTKNSHRLGRS